VAPLPPCPSWSTREVLDEGGKRPGGPRKEEDGRACENGSWYGKREVAFDDVGRSEGAEDKTEERKKPIDEEGARGVEGAGSVNEKVWTVEAG
jgi:hypothetical protein